MSNEKGEELSVVFGSGPVGLAVVSELLKESRKVRLVNRSGKAPVGSRVDVVKANAAITDETKELCRGASVVYHCASPPYHQWPELFPQLQEGILEGAAGAGAVLVAIDNMYMYGPTGGKPLTEDLPYKSEGRKGKLRGELALGLLEAHRQGRVRVAIGRASSFFGPNVRQSIVGEQVFGPAIRGKAARIIGNPETLHTQTYIGDIGKALVTLGKDQKAWGEVWHLPAAETVTIRRFLEAVYLEAGHPCSFRAAPRMMVELLGWVNPLMRELKEVLYQVEEPFIVDSSKFEKAFGNYTTPLKHAINATTNWYRDNSKL